MRGVVQVGAVTIMEPPVRLRRLGLIQAAVLPPEEYWVDELGGCACEDCITKHEAEQNPR